MAHQNHAGMHTQDVVIREGADEENLNGHHINGEGKKNSLGQCFEASPFAVQPTVTEPETTTASCTSRALKVPHIALLRKIAAEVISTYILIFLGVGSVMVQASSGVVTHVGISATWGMAVMMMIYAVGHISGAHMNPAVTLAFAAVRHFPRKEVPLYIGAQVTASICAVLSLRLMLGDIGSLGVTIPHDGNVGRSFALEAIITFNLMLVVSAVATDTRAIGELAGIAVGATVGGNVLVAGPISGASMNPARTIGSAVAGNNYKSIWVYMIAPTLGAILGALGYALIRGPDPSPVELDQMKRIKSLKR